MTPAYRNAYRKAARVVLQRDRIATAAIRTPGGEVFTVPRPGRHHTVIRVMCEATA